MVKRWQIDINFVEQGDIYFFYKPKKEVEKPRGIEDVSRFFFVLDPYGEAPARYIVMGSKKMPGFTDGGKTTWGFVQIVGGRGFETDRKLTTPVKGASRPAGEGIYTIITHRDHSHLLYSLELPEKPGEVQNAFEIKKEASYIFLERPVEVSPKGPEIPFSNFAPVKTSNNLNLRGTEVLLVGVNADVGSLGIKAEKDKETLASADIFSRLKLSAHRHPTASLISGKWE